MTAKYTMPCRGHTANFRIMHFTHCSAAVFHTLRSAFTFRIPRFRILATALDTAVTKIDKHHRHICVLAFQEFMHRRDKSNRLAYAGLCHAFLV